MESRQLFEALGEDGEGMASVVLARQAECLGHLGRLDEAAETYEKAIKRDEKRKAFWQAADIAIELGDLRDEGLWRNNIAATLHKLKRYDEARTEIMRAIECNSQFGHAAEPWTSFGILHVIEMETGNQTAVRTAWRQARDAYLAYRRQGGDAQGGGGKLADDVLGLIEQQKKDEIQPLFNQLSNDPNASDSLKQLIQAVESVINGARDPSPADNPALHYGDAAEILFFIERLEKPA